MVGKLDLFNRTGTVAVITEEIINLDLVFRIVLVGDVKIIVVTGESEFITVSALDFDYINILSPALVITESVLTEVTLEDIGIRAFAPDHIVVAFARIDAVVAIPVFDTVVTTTPKDGI